MGSKGLKDSLRVLKINHLKIIQDVNLREKCSLGSSSLCIDLLDSKVSIEDFKNKWSK